MAPDVTAVEPVTDAPVAVEPGGIEDAFSRMWRDTSAAGSDESTIHLRVLNFVAVSAGVDGERQFADVMEALPSRQPCRAILAISEDGGDAVRAWVSAQCWHTAAGARHICAEEIVLRGAHERPLASAVLALLVPELPVALWLIGDATVEQPLVAELLGAADRLFIDTSASADVRRALRAARRACAADGLTVVDLGWARMGSWRALVAQLFDQDDALHALTHLQAIEVISGGAAPSSEALLLAGWLVSRLELTVADFSQTGGEIGATLYDATRGVRLRVAAGGAPGAVREVRITTDDATFTVQQHDESGHMHVRAEWPGAPVHRTVAQRPADDASLIAQALDDPDDCEVFAAAAGAALALLGEADAATGTPAAPA